MARLNPEQFTIVLKRESAPMLESPWAKKYNFSFKDDAKGDILDEKDKDGAHKALVKGDKGDGDADESERGMGARSGRETVDRSGHGRDSSDRRESADDGVASTSWGEDDGDDASDDASVDDETESPHHDDGSVPEGDDEGDFDDDSSSLEEEPDGEDTDEDGPSPGSEDDGDDLHGDEGEDEEPADADYAFEEEEDIEREDVEDLGGEDLATFLRWKRMLEEELSAESVAEQLAGELKSASEYKPGHLDPFDTYAYSVAPEAEAGDRIVTYNANSKSLEREFLKDQEKIQGASRAISATTRRVLFTQAVARVVKDQRRGDLDRHKLHTLNRPGHRPNRNIYEKTIPGKSQKIAVMILVDQSGSMVLSDRIGLARRTAIAFGEALSGLQGLGLKFALYGWDNIEPDVPRSRWTSPRGIWDRIYSLRLHEYKAFDEQWVAVRNRCAAMDKGCENTDGDAVRWASHQLLMQRDVERRILLVLSDGQPACPSDLYRLGPDLKRVIEYISTVGIEPIGIGIQTNCVELYYPKSIVVHNLRDLETRSIGLLSKLLLDSNIAKSP